MEFTPKKVKSGNKIRKEVTHAVLSVTHDWETESSIHRLLEFFTVFKHSVFIKFYRFQEKFNIQQQINSIRDIDVRLFFFLFI